MGRQLPQASPPPVYWLLAGAESPKAFGRRCTKRMAVAQVVRVHTRMTGKVTRSRSMSQRINDWHMSQTKRDTQCEVPKEPKIC
jgi:hypothetical protein